MALSAITRGKIKQPHKVVLYGLDGVGKTTFGANAPAPIFLGAENGTAQQDVARFPQPVTWDDVTAALRTLATEEHEFKTLVVDTLDWLEPLAHAVIAKAEGVSNISEIGFNKGFDTAVDYWRLFLSRVEYLADKRGMNVVLLAHCQIKTFKNPTGDDFGRYELKLHHKGSSLIREWAEEVLFANYETYSVEKKGRVRGISSGSRVIHTTRDAAYDAKNRHGLPDKLPLSWEDFDAACRAEEPADPKAMLAAIETLLEGADPALTEKVRATVEAANGNAAKFSQIHNRLITIQNEKSEE